ncbi:hypothetical protein [Endozoicomonas sp. SESOKO3]|uniref:hypothetical protein n=1 Tax=Endozoicomonas sp. SESOKO3 TaxID=2828744 RepID=UPI0021497928|nr:hypothetical protein [Endozoicomonas sp. SESOKO3]
MALRILYFFNDLSPRSCNTDLIHLDLSIMSSGKWTRFGAGGNLSLPEWQSPQRFVHQVLQQCLLQHRHTLQSARDSGGLAAIIGVFQPKHENYYYLYLRGGVQLIRINRLPVKSSDEQHWIQEAVREWTALLRLLKNRVLEKGNEH